jgi:hypothetical protein
MPSICAGPINPTPITPTLYFLAISLFLSDVFYDFCAAK